MIKMAFSHRLLLGRLLTRSGDQAWDFAVPLILLKILPGELRVAAFYYFLIRLALVIFLPRLTSLIDRINRFNAARLGILLQLVGVLLGLFSIYFISMLNSIEPMWGKGPFIFAFVGLVLGGVVASLGSSFMDIAIANDLVPSSFTENELAAFNSRLRQVDLLTEVTAPVVAGLLLVLESPLAPLFGFLLIGLWNVFSFVPEYILLKSIFDERPDLKNKEINIERVKNSSFVKNITSGWKSFFSEPVSLAVIAYALLWLSVLSPHGVLLTAYLTDGWKLPEWEIGIFRGLGAFFGLGATLLFPWVNKKLGLIKTAHIFLAFQSASVITALMFFYMDNRTGQIGFLALILLSRIGLYGFSLGEMQIRQVGIRPEVRGEVNGFANALTGIATLGLYGAGALLPSTQDFTKLIVLSVSFVILGLAVYSVWVRKSRQIKY
ncbi:MAG: MFS transporter [Bdellovibrionaceae bacterium]|nr:MFS transporter [Pseudobdellovibrionaceae bacterium]